MTHTHTHTSLRKNLNRVLFFAMILFFVTSCSEESNNEVKNEIKNEQNISLRSSDPTSCFDESIIPQAYFCESFNTTNDFTLDRYPGCIFQVQYSFEKCIDQQTAIQHIYVKAVELITHDCQAYNDDVELADQNGTLDQFSAEFDGEIVQAAMIAAGLYYAEQFGFGATVVAYQTGSCANFCYSFLDKTGGFAPLISTKRNCGVACCSVFGHFQYSNACQCIDYYLDDNTEASITCEINTTFGCGPKSKYATDCVFTCDDLFN